MLMDGNTVTSLARTVPDLDALVNDVWRVRTLQPLQKRCNFVKAVYDKRLLLSHRLMLLALV
jgi:hypothetical protein